MKKYELINDCNAVVLLFENSLGEKSSIRGVKSETFQNVLVFYENNSMPPKVFYDKDGVLVPLQFVADKKRPTFKIAFFDENAILWRETNVFQVVPKKHYSQMN